MDFNDITRLVNLGVDGLLLLALFAGSRGSWVYGKSHQEAIAAGQAVLADKDKQIADLREDKDRQIADLQADKDRQIAECKERETMMFDLIIKAANVTEKATTQADRAVRVAESRIQQ